MSHASSTAQPPLHEILVAPNLLVPPPPVKSRSYSADLTPSEALFLYPIFQSNPNPSDKQKERMAEHLRWTWMGVHGWFKWMRENNPDPSSQQGSTSQASSTPHPSPDLLIAPAFTFYRPHVTDPQANYLAKIFAKNVNPSDAQTKEMARTLGWTQGSVISKFKAMRRKANQPDEDQIQILETEFASNRKPSEEDLKVLGKRLDMSATRVTKWFQGKRSEAKSEQKEKDKHASKPYEKPTKKKQRTE